MLVIKALNFAAEKHRDQERKGTKLPYIIHPVAVMHLISKYKKDSKNWENLQCAALLHDVLEDTECNYLEIEREFGPLVASIVLELTSDEKQIKKMGKNEYLISKMIKMSKYSFTLKLIDRLANISDKPTEKYINDTIYMCNTLLKERKDTTLLQNQTILDLKDLCNLRLKEYENNTSKNWSKEGGNLV